MKNIQESVVEYNIKTAQLWKTESGKLLLQYRKDKTAFKEILHSVVGKGGGGVLRTVPKFAEFSEYVRESLPEIEKGKFNIFRVKKFPKNQPISFISKICHIINPRDYPIIYDTNVKGKLKIKAGKHLEENWQEKIKEYKQKQKGKESLEDLYLVDSKIWAEVASKNSAK